MVEMSESTQGPNPTPHEGVLPENLEPQWGEKFWDADLSVAAQLLLDDPSELAKTAAALLLDVEAFEYGWDFEHATAALSVPHWQVSRFTDEICELIRASLDETMFGTENDCRRVIVRRTLPEPDGGWRGRVAERLGLDGVDKPTNQGRLSHVSTTVEEDGLRFRSHSELRAYRMLKHLQESAPSGASMTIAPNAAVRIRDHTWELDFMVTYARRSGVIEIDGPAGHRNRRAADRSRDKLLEDSGFTYVDRIPAEDTDDPEKLKAALQRFLNRLERG
jgi:hypothetical protein